MQMVLDLCTIPAWVLVLVPDFLVGLGLPMGLPGHSLFQSRASKGVGEEHWDNGAGEQSNLPKHELANFSFNQLQTASDAQLVTLAKLTPF